MSSISLFLLPFNGEFLLDEGSGAAADTLREARAGIARWVQILTLLNVLTLISGKKEANN
jgi:hypothetical protein